MGFLSVPRSRVSIWYRSLTGSPAGPRCSLGTQIFTARNQLSSPSSPEYSSTAWPRETSPRLRMNVRWTYWSSPAARVTRGLMLKSVPFRAFLSPTR